VTAEVAVLNKLAVALAADSAVTIGSGAQAKIYNTVNKIFELSDRQPIGVMIYGGLNFMGLPLEVIIKEYRRALRGEPLFRTVREAAEAFRQHLGTIQFPEVDATMNIVWILGSRLVEIANRTQKRILEDASGGRLLPSKFNSALRAEIRAEIARVQALPGCLSLDRATERQIDVGFEAAIQGMIDLHLARFNPSADTTRSIRRLLRLVLHRSELSENRTGVVVAGYGEDEICPSLISHEMDGIVGDRLKFVELQDIDIDRAGVRAEALGFAQDDMIEQFLMGVSRDFQSFSDNLWITTLGEFSDSVLDAAIADASARDAVRVYLQENVTPTLIARVRDQFDAFKEQTARRSVVSMIEHMPKQELSNLAAALVDLTSLKRRVSAVRETVGGEVDVAVISKSEGFVWVKRKHYFPAELNTRFSSRHYNVSVDRGAA